MKAYSTIFLMLLMVITMSSCLRTSVDGEIIVNPEDVGVLTESGYRETSTLLKYPDLEFSMDQESLYKIEEELESHGIKMIVSNEDETLTIDEKYASLKIYQDQISAEKIDELIEDYLSSAKEFLVKYSGPFVLMSVTGYEKVFELSAPLKSSIDAKIFLLRNNLGVYGVY
jgi:hypothetical protein